MEHKSSTNYHILNLQRIFQWLLAGILVVSSAIPLHAQEEIPNLHPAILTLAEENPNEPIRVIVQQNAREGLSRQALARSGGEVLESLPIINGLVMELPARAVLELAQSRGVRWITIDAPVLAGSLPGTTCNLLTNPGFEDGFTSWDDWDGTLQKQLSGQAHTGAFAAQLGQSTGTLSQNISDVQAGSSYYASGMFRRPSGAENAWMSFGITFMDANWGELDSIEVEIPASSTYIPLTASGTAPLNTRYMSIWVWKDSGGSINVDNLSVQKDDMLSGACNGFAPTGGYNLLENGGFEEELDDWYTNGDDIKDISQAYLGAKAVNLGEPSGSIAQAANVAYAGTTYTARALFHRFPGSSWAGIGIDFFDGQWNEIGDVYSAIPETNSYVPIAVSGVAPAGTAHASVWIYKNSGGQLYVDNVSLIADEVPDAFVQSTGTELIWHGPEPRNGQGVTVAVVDSGIAVHQDFSNPGSNMSRVVHSVDLTSGTEHNKDQYGHGTHVAGIIGGNGAESNGIHRGIAPGVNLLNMRISDGKGMTYASDLIEGLQWLYDNKDTYNIRVVNLSLNSTVPESYHTSPIDAAVELLWFSGMTVVVSAGNNGVGHEAVTLFAPANDPFVITVGATDDRATGQLQDDVVTTFSAYGTTIEGFAKPDLVAPGRNIISLSAGNGATMVKEHPSHRVDANYFRMSGTSMAAPVVSGIAALLLQDEPNLTPDQIKYRLTATAITDWPGYDTAKAGAGHVNAYAALHGDTTDSANTGIAVSQMLFTGEDSETWDSVSWNSVSWNSVSWNSVSWNSVSWNSVSWNSVSWASSIWDDWMITDFSSDLPPEPIPMTTIPKENLTGDDAVNVLFLPIVSK